VPEADREGPAGDDLDVPDRDVGGVDLEVAGDGQAAEYGPVPVTVTLSVAATYCQPGPLETWAGTCLRVVPAGTPVLAAPG
jgi:hypothetical protein